MMTGHPLRAQFLRDLLKTYGSVLEGLAEPLGPVLEGPTEPLDAVSRGLAEPLKLFSGSEHFTDSQKTWASANAGLNFLEGAGVPADTNPGLLEARTHDRTILSGWLSLIHI